MRNLMAIFFAIIAAVSLSQIPEFTQQYSQRLGGALDELRTIVMQFDDDAAAHGLTREQGLARYAAGSDEFLTERASSMTKIFNRYNAITLQTQQLNTSNAFERASTLIRYFDDEIGQATLNAFKPAVPVTTDGFVHTGIGAIFGYAFGWVFIGILGFPFRRKTRRLPHISR